MQGYYLIGGVCKKCINGCSLCADSETCQYCFSGYKLDSDNKCILDNQMDFNVNLYQKKKFQLIKLNYKDEVIPEEANNYNDVPECDANCEKCIDSSALCTECKSLYALEDNKCIMSCSDDNCLKCSKKFILEECEQCADGYYARGNRCYLRCSDENCKYCKMIDDEEVCTECMQGYELEKMSCKLIRNYIPLIYSIIGLLILIIFVVCFCWYRQKKLREIEAVINHRIRGGNFNNVDVYSRNKIK